MVATETHTERQTLAALRERRRTGTPITMLTCYDYPTARIEDEAGVDVVFVGDSVGTNVLGYESERDVTMDDMLHHLRAVRRGVRRAWLLVDLPAGSYATPATALANARRFIDAGADGVKLEGGLEQVANVRALTEAGIAVCGHIGYTPQTLSQPGRRPSIQGRDTETALALVEAAIALEAAGLAMVVLELVPAQLAAFITERLTIPTIGIGAGPNCDGQVLVVNDVLGITPFRLRLARRYAEVGEISRAAIAQYCADVVAGRFPAAQHTTDLADSVLVQVRQRLDR